ncbi:MAG: AAA family ATPase, partial [Corynebacterium pollutisoli]|nr:AAA family ATPase [Corynebacterium pollutisoli]
MRIHSLTIENFRGIERLTLEELPETGVIVIHGDNEQGKSTILDALHAALYEKH